MRLVVGAQGQRAQSRRDAIRHDDRRSDAVRDPGPVRRGGNFIDTSNNYLFFVNGTPGGKSEALLGRWRASRDIGDEIVIATKVEARPIALATDFDTPREGLSRAAIRAASERSRERLGVERIDLYYAHVPDQAGVPLDEQVAVFGELVADGMVGLLGLAQLGLAGGTGTGPCGRPTRCSITTRTCACAPTSPDFRSRGTVRSASRTDRP
jgi:Aldo/keto reductase family